MTTTTTLVHLPYDGPLEWWRDALVYEIDSPSMDAPSVIRAQAILDHAVSLGMTAVLVRPASMPDADAATALRAFVERAHYLGLRVITRVSGGLRPVTGPHAREANPVVIGEERLAEGLLDRARAFLDAGSDGIDLGTIVPPQVDEATDLDRLSHYLNTLQALVVEHVEDGALGADVSSHYPEALLHHFQDDWLHHLRDDHLVLAQWSAESITHHVATSLDEHSRFGAPPVWRYLPGHRVVGQADPGDGRRWFETGSEELSRRSLALAAFVLALPGACYVRQGDEVALLDPEKPEDPLALAYLVNERSATQGAQFASPLATIRHGAHVRREHALATAPLAFVKGLPWCPDGALAAIARDLLIVVNTSDSPVELPEHAEALLSSAPLEQRHGRLSIPPSTTAWLVAASVA